MLSKAKHPCTGFLTAFGMTRKSERNDMEGVLGMTKERYGAVQQNLRSFVNRPNSYWLI